MSGEESDGSGPTDAADTSDNTTNDTDDTTNDTTDDSDDEPTTEQRIRWAGYGVLVENGFDEFTTQAVADAAGVSQSLVHYYFDTKADLVFSLFESGIENLEAQIAKRADADDPRERLLALARVTLRDEDHEDFAGTDDPDEMDDFDETVDFARLLLEIEAQAPYEDRLRDAVAYDQEFLREYVADAVAAGVESGQFRAVDPDAFAATYVSAIRAGQNWRAIFAADDYSTPVREGLVAMVDDYLVAEGEASGT